jgi:gliding motility-associated-like protein
MEMVIFNRWGEKIFESSYPNGGWWDGTFNNKPCQDDVYVFILKSTNIVGLQKEFKGNVTLLR